MGDNLISLTEYAKMHGIADSTARQRAARGSFKTAQKIGNMWVIDKNEPYVDNRIKEGRYIGLKRERKNNNWPVGRKR